MEEIDLKRYAESAVFLGFCPKEYWPVPNGENDCNWKPVREVCSAGDCIASRPEGWIERWDWNRASCWNDEAAAWACVAPEAAENYRLYAFRAIPLVFDTSGRPYELLPEDLFYTDMPALPPEPDLSGYIWLGYDIVQYAGFANYGCSPLSCNGVFQHYTVNACCLLESLEEAGNAALAFGIEEPEPGPYIIFEILRKRATDG